MRMRECQIYPLVDGDQRYPRSKPIGHRCLALKHEYRTRNSLQKRRRSELLGSLIQQK